MLLSLLVGKQYLNKPYENFTDISEEEATAVGTFIAFFIILMISSYGAARLSYFYNMNTGNSRNAVFWSVLAFMFSDFYYPMYSFFLNPQSVKGRNNIPIPSVVANM